MNQGPQENEESAESQAMKDIRAMLVPLDLVELLDHKANRGRPASLELQAQKETLELEAQEDIREPEG